MHANKQRKIKSHVILRLFQTFQGTPIFEFFLAKNHEASLPPKQKQNNNYHNFNTRTIAFTETNGIFSENKSE